MLTGLAVFCRYKTAQEQVDDERGSVPVVGWPGCGGTLSRPGQSIRKSDGRVLSNLRRDTAGSEDGGGFSMGNGRDRVQRKVLVPSETADSFPSEQASEQAFEKTTWPDGTRCSGCGAVSLQKRVRQSNGFQGV